MTGKLPRKVMFTGGNLQHGFACIHISNLKRAP